MATVNKGNTAVRETWESGQIVRAEQDSTEIVKQGLYADLAAVQPAKGVELVTGFVVEHSTLTREKGGWGKLVIALREKDVSTTGGKPIGAIESTIEVDMSQLERPILARTEYSGYAPMIELWRASPATLRSQYKYNDANGNEQTLTGEALKVATLELKGIETWLDFAPVVTRMSTYKTRPDPEDIGKIASPPVSVPGTWQYLKTADRIVQQADKKYCRTEQWTGAKEWSTDLYETA